MRTILTVASLMLGLFAMLPAAVPGQQAEDAIVKSAIAVLRENMAGPDKQIPQSLMAGAQGVAIAPGMITGGFVAGVERGRGAAIVRDETGNWRAPAFITMTGGSIGFQAGAQTIDVVLVFKSLASVTNPRNRRWLRRWQPTMRQSSIRNTRRSPNGPSFRRPTN
jgi:SH3 domain-containing YSC84-like protein 1